MRDNVLIAAICAVALIEVVALLVGIDGALLTSVVGAICLLAGLRLESVRQARKRGKTPPPL